MQFDIKCAFQVSFPLFTQLYIQQNVSYKPLQICSFRNLEVLQASQGDFKLQYESENLKLNLKVHYLNHQSKGGLLYEDQLI